MGRNGYLARKQATENACFQAGLEMGRQQVLDALCIVLHNPKVMKKDTFGRGRLLTVIHEIATVIDHYHKAWYKNDETDVYRFALDAAIADAFGVKSLQDTFLKRYEYSPEYDYKNHKWKK